MDYNGMTNGPQQMPPTNYQNYINMKPCKSCGNLIAKNAKVCPSCGAKNKKPIYKRVWFWVIVIVFFFIIIGPPSCSSDDIEVTTASNSIIEQESTTSISQFKDSCVPFDYKAIARNPSNYEGQFVKFRGKVIQVSESSKMFSEDKNLTLRIDSKEDEYGFWEDTVYVEFVLSTNDNRILEDDIVTVYGVCSGVTSYTTVLGSSMTIPSVNAKYIEVETD